MNDRVVEGELTPLAVLREARAILSKHDAWTQHAVARNRGGQGVYAESHEAVCFCATGSLHRAVINLSPATSDGARYDFVESIRKLFYGVGVRPSWGENYEHKQLVGGYRQIEDWNDSPSRTKREVIAQFSAVIAMQSRKPRAVVGKK